MWFPLTFLGGFVGGFGSLQLRNKEEFYFCSWCPYLAVFFKIEIFASEIKLLTSQWPH